MMLWLIGLVALQLRPIVGASVTRQVKLGDINYFLPPTEAWRFVGWDEEMAPNAAELIPLTVVTIDGLSGANAVADALRRYGEEDDVWSPDFAEVLYLQSKPDSSWGPVDAIKDELKGTYNISTILPSSGSVSAKKEVSDGPYFIHRYTGKVYQSYRLYVDYNQAFVVSSYQDQNDTHHTVPAAIESAAGLTMAVPSRLYFKKSAQKPLAGLRIGAKDIFDLKGLRTGGGSKALYTISSPAVESAAAVQKLIDAGAVIVGKNKLSEFAYGGYSAPEHIDYLVPTNPRGDGYRTTSGSSHGSAAAMASYPWLDASLGSDTGGSVRSPAGNNGVHGNKPSRDTVSLNGVIPLSTSFDTAGILVRDPVLWGDIIRVLCDDDLEEYNQYPSRIYIAPTTNASIAKYEETQPELAGAMRGFLQALEDIASGNVSVFNIDTVWEENYPAGAPEGLYIGHLIQGLYNNLTAYEQWIEFGQDFSDTYKSSHDGKFPYMVPATRSAWFNARDNYDEDMYEQDLKSLGVFREWAEHHTLKPDEKTCSDAIYVYFLTPDSEAFYYKPDMSADIHNPWIADLISSGTQSKLDALTLNVTLQCETHIGTDMTCGAARSALEEAQALPEIPEFFYAVASIAGFPDFAMTLESIDFGDVMKSDATLQNQKLPLAVDLVAARGCDFMLANLIKELADRGVVRHVRTGEIV